jgi:CO/xanthine dehydrogenase Mo-binding subunit
LVRTDYREKVTGQAEFVSDVALAGMVHARVFRSVVPHALIRAIDTSVARAYPGVVAVITGADIGGLKTHWGVCLRDRPLIAIEKVRYIGEPVALIVAETEQAAEDALDLIEADYEVLPHVATAADALAADAPLIHGPVEVLNGYFFGGVPNPVPGTNICQSYTWETGSTDEALAGADRVFESTYTFPKVFHYAMEPHCVVADFDGKDMTLWSCAQAPTAAQKVVAEIFGLPLARVRVISPYVGGGFGGKSSVKIDPLAALLAWTVRRPVRLCLSVSESMLTCRRLGAEITIRTGVKSDGTLVAKDVRILMDGGAYADSGPAVAVKSANRAIGPYRIPNIRLEALSVYTNTVPGASFRSIGGPQSVWASESQMDEIAEALAIDPSELRFRNLLKRGERMRPDLKPFDVDMTDGLATALRTMDHVEQTRGHNGTARGIAVAACDPGQQVASAAMLRLKIDGSVMVLANSVEVGQGVREVLRRFAAEALAQPIDAVAVMTPDTALVPFDWGTGSSRSSILMGLAISGAADDIRTQVTQAARDLLGVGDSEIRLVPGGLTDGVKTWTFSELLYRLNGLYSGEFIGIGRITPHYNKGQFKQGPLFWETASGCCTADVDEDTGEIHVRRYVSVADVGRVLNRLAAEGQDEGAVAQGLGHALYEELLFEDAHPVNATMLDYHVPTFTDIPDDFETVLIENQDGPGVGGARGMGEGAILPVAPAIANALASTYGIRMHDLPMTPERVWRALQARKEHG